ncbi:MAG TPA: methyltransferase domain-containing protein [Solirubrobacteraceae bacterium]|nr:methyltransferase domain-containing protein [Solirubrobacteraceae bacterium]
MREAVVPERFIPAAMRGQLLEAEHLVRYWWAAHLAGGRRVLDAGCGTAYGTRMLAEGGAKRVVGVDRAASVLDAARPGCPDNVDLIAADLRELPFEDRSFDLVVCFEVIEHLEAPDAALQELERIVSADGVLLVSSPNRDVYEPGNPHHLHEYTPTELQGALERLFAHVELRRQANLIASSVMPDDVAAGDDLDPVHDVRLAKCVSVGAGEETYTLALASHAPLAPDRATTAVATGVTEIRRWVEIYAEQQAAVEERDRLLRRLEDEAVEVRRAREVLLDGERAHARATKLEEELRIAREEIAALHERLERSAAAIEGMQRSPSWRLTAPLRALKRPLRGR